MIVEFVTRGPAEDEVLVVPVAKGSLADAIEKLPVPFRSMAASATQQARFEGALATSFEHFFERDGRVSRLLLVGVGAADAAAFERAGSVVAARYGASGAVAVFADLSGVEPANAARFALGAALRAWRFDRYRTKLTATQKPTLEKLTVSGVDAARDEWLRWSAVVEGVGFTRELVSEPGNVIYPQSFVDRCAVHAEAGISVEVLDEQQMAELGMGAILGVGQGSARPPRMLVLHWRGPESPETPILLVGKGVTFDTGGISLKPGAGMEDMKWDMGGAGAVAGALLALAKRNAPVNVVGICALAENMPDANAQRPGDVVTTLSGQTVEVINTDAEGRLVLCDAMTWAQRRFKPEVMVDLATLTGAMMVALGNEHAGLFSNDHVLARDLVDAGLATDEKLWRFPLSDAYNRLIDSQIADMKNVGPRNAGSITAAQFLQRYVEDGVKWAHLDIAGMVWADKDGPTWAKGATGYGVRLLEAFVHAKSNAAAA